MQADGQLCDLADSLLLLGHGGPDVLLKLLVEHTHGLFGFALGRVLPHSHDGSTCLVTPELVLKLNSVKLEFLSLGKKTLICIGWLFQRQHKKSSLICLFHYSTFSLLKLFLWSKVNAPNLKLDSTKFKIG